MNRVIRNVCMVAIATPFLIAPTLGQASGSWAVPRFTPTWAELTGSKPTPPPTPAKVKRDPPRARAETRPQPSPEKPTQVADASMGPEPQVGAPSDSASSAKPKRGVRRPETKKPKTTTPDAGDSANAAESSNPRIRARVANRGCPKCECAEGGGGGSKSSTFNRKRYWWEEDQ